MKTSRYWQFILQEDQVKVNWCDTLSKYGKGFLSAPHDKETNQAYVEACKKVGRKLNRTKKYLKPAYRLGILVLDDSKSRPEVTQILHKVGAKSAKLIDDQDFLDRPLKNKIVELITGHATSKLKFFGGISWDSEAQEHQELIPGKKPEVNFYHYYKPQCYSQSQLIEYCYWTKKCCKYLPAPDDEYKNSYYAGQYYPVWSADTIMRIEQTHPEVMRIAKRKYAKQHDPKQLDKVREANKKRRATLALHKAKKQQKIKQQTKLDIEKYTKEYQADLKQYLVKLPTEQHGLVTACYKMTVINHLAKYLHDYTNDFSGYLATRLQQMYSVEDIYSIKNTFLQLLYLINPKELKLTIYDPPQEDYWYDDWGNIHISNKPPHYYSCYNFALTFANIDFDYHMPYPIGNSYFPAIRNLSKIEQEPNFDGPYMFGEESDYTEQCYAADHNLIDDIKDWIDQTAKKHNLLNLDKLCLEKSQTINQAKDAHHKEAYKSLDREGC